MYILQGLRCVLINSASGRSICKGMRLCLFVPRIMLMVAVTTSSVPIAECTMWFVVPAKQKWRPKASARYKGYRAVTTIIFRKTIMIFLHCFYSYLNWTLKK